MVFLQGSAVVLRADEITQFPPVIDAGRIRVVRYTELRQASIDLAEIMRIESATGELEPGDHKQIVDILAQFKEMAPKDTVDKGLAAIAEFESKAAELKAKTLLMKSRYLRIVEAQAGESQADDFASYVKLCNESTSLIDETYRKALDVMDYLPHVLALRFALTVVDKRVQQRVYDTETYEGAAKLLDYGVRLPSVLKSAARSSAVVGDFELTEVICKSVEDTDGYGVENQLSQHLAAIKKQYREEEELVESDPDDLPRVRFETSRGHFVVELFIHEAPSSVAHFIHLVDEGFYKDAKLSRNSETMLSSLRNPRNVGSERSRRYVADEQDRDVVRRPLRGSLTFLPVPESKRGTAQPGLGSQFTVLLLPLPDSAVPSTVFGRVVDGWSTLGEFQFVRYESLDGENVLMDPPDRILKCEVITRPKELPEVVYDPFSGLRAQNDTLRGSDQDR